MKRRQPTPYGHGAFIPAIGPDAFSLAIHSHIQELAYEMAKDPEYQELLRKWTEDLLAALLKRIREPEKKLVGFGLPRAGPTTSAPAGPTTSGRGEPGA